MFRDTSRPREEEKKNWEQFRQPHSPNSSVSPPHRAMSEIRRQLYNNFLRYCRNNRIRIPPLPSSNSEAKIEYPTSRIDLTPLRNKTYIHELTAIEIHSFIPGLLYPSLLKFCRKHPPSARLFLKTNLSLELSYADTLPGSRHSWLSRFLGTWVCAIMNLMFSAITLASSLFIYSMFLLISPIVFLGLLSSEGLEAFKHAGNFLLNSLFFLFFVAAYPFYTFLCGLYLGYNGGIGFVSRIIICERFTALFFPYVCEEDFINKRAQEFKDPREWHTFDPPTLCDIAESDRPLCSKSIAEMVPLIAGSVEPPSQAPVTSAPPLQPFLGPSFHISV